MDLAHRVLDVDLDHDPPAAGASTAHPSVERMQQPGEPTLTVGVRRGGHRLFDDDPADDLDPVVIVERS